MKYDVVVIGGGVSGLATSALLAKQGKRVVVLEKGNQPGGRAYTYEGKGFTLNYGPHAVYRPQSGFLADLMGREHERRTEFRRRPRVGVDRREGVREAPHALVTRQRRHPFAPRHVVGDRIGLRATQLEEHPGQRDTAAEREQLRCQQLMRLRPDRAESVAVGPVAANRIGIAVLRHRLAETAHQAQRVREGLRRLHVRRLADDVRGIHRGAHP